MTAHDWTEVPDQQDHCLRVFLKAILFCTATCLWLFAPHLFGVADASDSGNHGGSVASNDFGPVDLGDSEKVRKSGSYMNLPEKERNYYEHGQKRFNHDGKGGNDKNGNGVRDKGEKKLDRADLASFCARYNRGGPPDAKLPGPPATLEAFNELIERIKKCVDDLLEPDLDPQKGRFFSDAAILKGINRGHIGIGKKADFKKLLSSKRTGFVCIEHAQLLASLLRELGLPVREVNVPLSRVRNGQHRYVYQEAAVQVFFDGSWHYFDAYLTAGGKEPDPNRTPDGLLGGSYTDRKVHHTTTGVRRIYWWRDYTPNPKTGDPRPGGPWKKSESDPAFRYEKISRSITIEQAGSGVHAFVTQESTGLTSGWTPDLVGEPERSGSLLELLLFPSLTGARLDIPRSGFVPGGIEFPPFATSYVGVAPRPFLPDDIELEGASIEAIVINDPVRDGYCASVWNPTQEVLHYQILVSVEGDLDIDRRAHDGEAALSGTLEPGELKVAGCFDVTTAQNGRPS